MLLYFLVHWCRAICNFGVLTPLGLLVWQQMHEQQNTTVEKGMFPGSFKPQICSPPYPWGLHNTALPWSPRGPIVPHSLLLLLKQVKQEHTHLGEGDTGREANRGYWVQRRRTRRVWARGNPGRSFKKTESYLVTRLKSEDRLPFPEEFRQNSGGTCLIVMGEEQTEGNEELMSMGHILECVPEN